MKINNSQGHLISKLTKHVLQINLLELKLICVKSGAIKFKYIIKIGIHISTQFFEDI